VRFIFESIALRLPQSLPVKLFMLLFFLQACDLLLLAHGLYCGMSELLA